MKRIVKRVASVAESDRYCRTGRWPFCDDEIIYGDALDKADDERHITQRQQCAGCLQDWTAVFRLCAIEEAPRECHYCGEEIADGQ